MIVYFHKNPQTEEVFYVGIGCNVKRAHQYVNGRNIHYKRYVAKYGLPIVEIVHEGLTKQKACELEIKYIGEFGKKINGGLLVNMSDGGDISSLGVKRSAETRAKISAIQKGRKQSPEQVAFTRAHQNRPDIKERQRLHKLGKKQTPEFIQKRADGMKKVLLNTQTGIFYLGIKEAAHSACVNHSSLRSKLSGHKVNNTPFIYA